MPLSLRIAGLDVGFSTTRKSSGVGVLVDGVVDSAHHFASAAVPAILVRQPFACIAIDGPILPIGAPPDQRRLVEQALASGGFQRRCKAALSHVPGTGLQLRIAAGHAAERLSGAATPAVSCASVCAGVGIVEAFPNAFLGVCLSDDAYAAQPALARGRKFDWLYDRWIEARLAFQLVNRIGLPVSLAEAMPVTRNHDERAAIVCLMTAFCAAAGRFAALGEPSGGWIVLPPRHAWAAWARDAAALARQRLPGLQLVGE